MNSGCICCSLVGDFSAALKEVLEKYSPDRVIIEPSGVGKLSDVAKAVKNAGDNVSINSTAVVVDASKCKMYMKNYGEFYNNQVEYAGTIILSRTQKISDEKLDTCLKLIREKNTEASVITTPWDTMTKNTTITMKTVKSTTITMMMDMDTITTMQMRYLQAGVLKQHINFQKMNLKTLLTSFLLAAHMVKSCVPKE